MRDCIRFVSNVGGMVIVQRHAHPRRKRKEGLPVPMSNKLQVEVRGILGTWNGGSGVLRRVDLCAASAPATVEVGCIDGEGQYGK